MTDTLKVTKIEIRNVLGIRELAFQPNGTLTTISGPNASGKSSVIDAINSVFEGGHDPTMLHDGAEEGEVLMMLSDGVTIRKRITPARSRVTVRNPAGHKLSAPQTFINDLIDANPIDLLTLDAKDRAEYLLDSLPMAVDEADLEQAAGYVYDDEINADGHALEVIEDIRSEIYDDRTGVNRAAKEKRKTIKQLKESLPDDEGDEAESLQEQIDHIEATRDELQAARSEELESISRQQTERESQIKDEAQKKIDKIKAERDEKLKKLMVETDQDRSHIKDGYAEDITECKQHLATLRERQKSAQQHQNTRQMIQEHQAQAEELEEESEAITQAIDNLDELKRETLSNLPIDGDATINADGDIIENGIPFDRLNTARQIEIAVSIAQSRARFTEVPIVCVDGVERLDDETMEAFREWAEETDLQLIVTRVTSDDQLTIEQETASAVV